MITPLVPPLTEFVHRTAFKSVFSWSTKPVVFGAHEMERKPGVAGAMVSVGAPSVCTATGNAQKPPVRLN